MLPDGIDQFSCTAPDADSVIIGDADVEDDPIVKLLLCVPTTLEELTGTAYAVYDNVVLNVPDVVRV